MKGWPDCIYCGDFGVHIVDGVRRICPYAVIESNQQHPTDQHRCRHCGQAPATIIYGAIHTVCGDCLHNNEEP